MAEHKDIIENFADQVNNMTATLHKLVEKMEAISEQTALIYSARSALQIIHDLDDNCTCETCARVQEIAKSYGH